MEVWVNGNRRAYLAGAAVLLLFEACCVVIAMDWLSVPMLTIARVLAAVSAVGAIPVLVMLLVHARLPRLAYEEGHLLVFAGTIRPVRVPIEAVEVFFRGQSPIEVNVAGSDVQSANVVVRLAERAENWHAREMRSTFGQWKCGYISLNGAWCEPINADLMHKLNRRLVEVKKK